MRYERVEEVCDFRWGLGSKGLNRVLTRAVWRVLRLRRWSGVAQDDADVVCDRYSKSKCKGNYGDSSLRTE